MSLADWKEREKAQRRNDIVDAAERLFFTKSYHQVSMDDIAGALMLSKPMIYVHFRTKESLFFAVALRGARLLADAYQDIRDSGPGSQRKLLAMGEEFFAFSQKHPDYYRMIDFARSGALDTASSPEGQAFAEAMDETIVLMSDAIKEGMDEGSFRRDMDPLEIAIYLVTSSESLLKLRPGLKAKLAARGISYEQYIGHAMSLIRSGPGEIRD